MDDRKQQFVERMGLMSEADGLPRIAGRIFGYLLLTPGECSLDELATSLAVSRASISNDARRLTQMGLLERRSRPGDRRDYYSISRDAFRRSIEARIRSLRDFHGLIEEARSMAAPELEVMERLSDWDEAHVMLVNAFEAMLTELDRRNQGRRANS